MTCPNCCPWIRLFLIALTACITASPSATAQLPPARATNRQQQNRHAKERHRIVRAQSEQHARENLRYGSAPRDSGYSAGYYGPHRLAQNHILYPSVVRAQRHSDSDLPNAPAHRERSKSHTILAVLLTVLAVLLGFTALVLKPTMDRMAIYSAED